MQNNGLKQGTLKAVNYQLKYLDKNIDLMKPEQVKAFIAQMKQANSYKQCMVKAYNYFADINGIQRLETHFKYQRKIPLIPSSENVRKIISASSKKYATIFTILDETGLEEQELASITRAYIDEKQGIINAQGCKGHKSRSFKLKPETAEMLRQYLNKYTEEKPFPDSHYQSEIWERTRNKLADKLQQPELKKIPRAVLEVFLLLPVWDWSQLGIALPLSEDYQLLTNCIRGSLLPTFLGFRDNLHLLHDVPVNMTHFCCYIVICAIFFSPFVPNWKKFFEIVNLHFLGHNSSHKCPFG